MGVTRRTQRCSQQSVARAPLDRPIALPIPRNEAPSARARAIALFRDDPVAMRVSIFAFVARCLVTLRAVWHAPVIKDAAEAIGGASSGALDTGDDKLGDETISANSQTNDCSGRAHAYGGRKRGGLQSFDPPHGRRQGCFLQGLLRPRTGVGQGQSSSGRPARGGR